MKKNLFWRIAVVAAILLCLCFAVSCEPKNEQTKPQPTDKTTPHQHNYIATVTPPTCTQRGYTVHTCEGCGDSYKDQYVPATRHVMENGVCTVCGGAGNGLSYRLCSDRRSYLVSVGNSSDERIIIPAEHEGKPVVGIAAGGFSGCTTLREITLPESVYMIGEKAFYNCTELISVVFGGPIETIDASAFAGCTGLTEIDLSKGTLSIGVSAFSGCDRLERVLWSEDLETVYADAFLDCVGLTSVCFSQSVTKIAFGAFRGCPLTSVSVHEENKTYYSVDGCLIQRETKKLILGTVGAAIPSDGSVTAIGAYAFAGNSALESIFVPAAVEELERFAFRGCTGLQEVTFGEDSRLKTIGIHAFRDCTALREVILPDSVQTMGDYAFGDCSSLAKIHLPADLKVIPMGFLSGCASLVSVEIPSGVQTIDFYAFEKCTSLESLRIPASVTAAYGDVFRKCTGLRSFAVASGSPLSNYTLDTNFGESPNLCELEGPVWLIERFVGNCDKILSLTINDGDDVTERLVSRYKNLTSVTISGNVSRICSSAFSGYSTLESVTVSTECQSVIAQNAFAYCPALSSVVISPSVTSIDSTAFSKCGALTELTVPAFALKRFSLKNLKTATINSGTELPEWAFENCTQLTSVSLPDTLTVIGRSAFSGCDNLSSVILPDALTTIGSSAFSGCISLTSVHIPAGVTSVGDYAFSRCSKLTSVTFENTENWYCRDKAINVTDAVVNARKLTATGIMDWMFDPLEKKTAET